MRSSNPVFKRFEQAESSVIGNTATYQGITIKTIAMFLLAIATGFFARQLLIEQQVEALSSILVAAMIVGFISVIIGIMSLRLSAPFALLYAACEGVMLGTITVIFESVYPGIGLTAVGATAILFGVMLFLYMSRAIRVTSRFRKIMFVSLISILIFSIFGSIFGSLIFPQGVSPLIILGISGFLIIYGAFMLTLDFDRAEQVVKMGLDKRYEWQVSLGLMITIVWIYVEVLRFLFILYSMFRRD